MSNLEIIEGNKLIAEFDGGELVNDAPDAYPNGYFIFEDEYIGTSCTSEELNYNKSWDWLMPVAIKLKEVVRKDKPFSEARARFSDVRTTLMAMNITEVWHSIVEFIKWHNQQLK